MGRHQYAIKHNGRTLGIHDQEQLSRLVYSGELKADASVFVIKDKRWVSLTSLLDVESAVQQKETVPQPAQIAEEQDLPPIQEFSSLINEIEVKEDKSARVPTQRELERDLSIETGRTIHKLPALAAGRSARLSEPAVAAKVPNPEGWFGETRRAIAVMALALFLGLAAGLFGSTMLQDDLSNTNGSAIRQAESHSVSPSTAD